MISLLGLPTNGLVLKHRIKVKFVIVGAWNTVFGYLVFVGLDYLFASFFWKRYVAYMTASVIANILAITNAYICHKYWTFKSVVKGKGILFEFARFVSTYLFTIVLGLALLPILVEMLNFDPKIAAALIILPTTLISYLGHSRFSFNK